jgi:hypothetical protein
MKWVSGDGWWISELLGLRRSELFLLEASGCGREQFKILEEGKRPTVKAAANKRLVRIMLWKLVLL